jgi:hypothetical protein
LKILLTPTAREEAAFVFLLLQLDCEGRLQFCLIENHKSTRRVFWPTPIGLQTPLHDLYFRYGNDKAAASTPEFGLLIQNLFGEIPGQEQDVIRLRLQ